MMCIPSRMSGDNLRSCFYSDLSLTPNGKISQKGVRVSPTRKGPRVLASKRLTKNSLARRNGTLKKSPTAQSKTNARVSQFRCDLTITLLEISGIILHSLSLAGLSNGNLPLPESAEDSDESEVFLDEIAHSVRSESSDISVSSSSENQSIASVDSVPKTEVKRIIPAIRPSYFPFVPPYVNFCMHDEKTDELPEEIRKLLKWRLSPITPIVVKRTVSNSGT